jgi:hypothetical protein
VLRTHVRLRLLAVVTAVAALLVGAAIMAAPSQAAFALTCNLNSVAQARVDFPNGFNYTSDHSHVDTSSIRYRSINRSTGTVASWKADAVWIQLWNAHTGHWDLWTGKGGTATDGTYVGPDYTWDPSAKNSVGSDYWNKLRMHTWFNGYQCSSIEVTF